jgi:DNA repair protein RadC
MSNKRYTFPSGLSSRIIVSIVAEDALTHDADNAENIYRFWQSIIAEQPDHEPDKESVCVILLNTRLRAYAWHRVSLGTLSESSCHPREVLRPVITGGAYAFALMHNHPSGDPSPSRADEVVTRRMVEAANLMQIHFVDHVIVGTKAPGRQPYFSFREAGIIP